MNKQRELELCPQIEVSSKWFEVRKLKNDVFSIYEPYHFQEIISYLIVGDEKALLIDTGMGLADIRKIVEELTDKPVIAINSHTHFDHVGCNYMFDEVRVFNDQHAIDRLKKGYSHYELLAQIEPELFEKVDLVDVELEDYSIKPSIPRPVNDGDFIDLGGRRLEIIHTPGHSPDSIMILDRANRILFTGDSYYPGYIYAHFAGAFYNDSDLAQYAKSMKMVTEYLGDVDMLHPSHNIPVDDPKILYRVADALDELSRGVVSGTADKLTDNSLASLPEEGKHSDVYVTQNNLFVYGYEDFKIITPKVSTGSL